MSRFIECGTAGVTRSREPVQLETWNQGIGREACVPEIMHAFGRSADSGRRIWLTTTCERPAPLPVDLPVYG